MRIMTFRTRRSPDEARQIILDAAASLLAEAGVAGVHVRAVASRVGMTDAGVTHHFGNRDGLLRELLRHGGRELRGVIDEIVRSWLDDPADTDHLVDRLSEAYRSGYGELAAALYAAGWRDRGSGMLDPLVEALHARRPDRDQVVIDDTRLAVAALHQALATETLYGPAFRRSAGISGPGADRSDDQRRWWARQLHLALGGAPTTQV